MSADQDVQNCTQVRSLSPKVWYVLSVNKWHDSYNDEFWNIMTYKTNYRCSGNTRLQAESEDFPFHPEMNVNTCLSPSKVGKRCQNAFCFYRIIFLTDIMMQPSRIVSIVPRFLTDIHGFVSIVWQFLTDIVFLPSRFGRLFSYLPVRQDKYLACSSEQLLKPNPKKISKQKTAFQFGKR